MTSMKLWHLENFKVFKKLPRADVMKIEPLTSMTSYRKSSVVYLPDTDLTNIYFLKMGRVQISRINDSGEEILHTVLFPGDIFGRLPYMEAAPAGDMALATEASLICTMQSSAFEQLLSLNIRLNTEIIKLIGWRLRKIERRFEDFVHRDAKTRIIEFLRDFAAEYGSYVGREVFIPIGLSHREIAILTATSRQTVTTVLNSLRSQGTIDFSRRKIIIRDIALFGL